MTMKSNLALFTAMAAMMESGMVTNGQPKKRRIVEPDTEGDIQRRNEAYQKVLQKKGLKWFSIDGVQVQALNLKNAKRKVKKVNS